MTTISVSSTIGVALASPSYANPVVINPGVTISSGGTGVYAAYGSWTVQNAGSIAGNAASPGGAGILLNGGGGVTNQSGAAVSGFAGIYGAYVALTVVNAGSITGNAASSGGAGVLLHVGGGVTNQSGAAISGFYGISGTGGSGSTVVNAGSITGNAASSGGAGVLLNGNGSVANQSGGTISGFDGFHGVSGIGFASLSVVNAGGITGNTASAGGAGVLLNGNGSVTNQSGGTISGYYGFYGISGGGLSSLSVVNAGGITGNTASSGGAGVLLKGGGSVVNQSGGAISGFDGISGSGPSGLTVVNAGGITGNAASSGAAGVLLNAGGSVMNQSGGAISGFTGIYGAKHGGALTVVNAGTISGSSFAVQFAAGYANRLVVDAGAVFNGTVVGGNTIGATSVSTLELAGGIGSGTLPGLGSQFIDFAQVTLDSRAAWTLSGTDTIVAGATLTELSRAILADAGTLANYGGIVLNNYGALSAGGLTGTGSVTIGTYATVDVHGTIASGQTIAFTGGGSGGNGYYTYLIFDNPGSVAGSVTNFNVNETIDLNGIDPASVHYSGGVLSFYGGSFPLSLARGGTVVASALYGGGAAITFVPCFAAGTRIATPRGGVAVELLREGDTVLTVSGGRQNIQWIGHRHVDCRRHPDPARVLPIRIAPHAFGEGRPGRPLLLSPDHSVFVEDVLIPIKFLLNGSTVARIEVDTVTYYHIELPRHDVVLADGMPAESYLDTGDRSSFANGGGPVRLFADFSTRLWEAYGCAPLIVTGPKLTAARALVASFAASRAKPTKRSRRAA